MSDCSKCKCEPVCAVRKGLKLGMERAQESFPVDIRQVVKITVECKYFLQDKDPNIPDRFQ